MKKGIRVTILARNTPKATREGTQSRVRSVVMTALTLLVFSIIYRLFYRKDTKTIKSEPAVALS